MEKNGVQAARAQLLRQAAIVGTVNTKFSSSMLIGLIEHSTTIIL